MNLDYNRQLIAQLLKQARLRNGLSQRALGERVGVPQSHISKIEQGAVDIRLSSLIEMARALDLEPVLVPRRALPAVQAIVRQREPSSLGDSASPRYSLDGENDE